MSNTPRTDAEAILHGTWIYSLDAPGERLVRASFASRLEIELQLIRKSIKGTQNVEISKDELRLIIGILENEHRIHTAQFKYASDRRIESDKDYHGSLARIYKELWIKLSAQFYTINDDAEK